MSRYPSDEMVEQWGNEFANMWLRGSPMLHGVKRGQYIARKACDWTREQQVERIAEIVRDSMNEAVPGPAAIHERGRCSCNPETWSGEPNSICGCYIPLMPGVEDSQCEFCGHDKECHPGASHG